MGKPVAFCRASIDRKTEFPVAAGEKISYTGKKR